MALVNNKIKDSDIRIISVKTTGSFGPLCLIESVRVAVVATVSVAPAVAVSVFRIIDDGLTEQLGAPIVEGETLHERLTKPENPPSPLTVTVAKPLCPAAGMVMIKGLVNRLKPPVPRLGGTAVQELTRFAAFTEPSPVARS